jgi:hypothetical protein
MGRVVHFEIHAGDPERAIAFYARLFGWKFQHIPQLDYWLIAAGEGEGINGGLTRRRGPAPQEGQPVNSFVSTIEVENVDAAVEAALSAGGRLALAKMAVPGVGWAAYVTDTEGNILGLYKADPAAA